MPMEKSFHINRAGCSICCRLYAGDRPIRRLVIFGHGFGGHKDNRAAKRYADYVCAKHRDMAVLCFDWPCHGEDARKKLLLSDCDLYLQCVIDYVREQVPEARLLAYATSFGGSLCLKYIARHGNPFAMTALRCPALPMHQVILHTIITPEEAEKLAKGKEVLVGFVRKIKISPEFLESLRQADVTQMDFTPYRDEILILHGTKDEIVPIGPVEAFAERNRIPFFPIENADHRFVDPGKMQEAIVLIGEFLE